MSRVKNQLIKKRMKLVNEIEFNLDFIKGSLTKVSRRNKIIGEFYHLTYKDELQKTHTKYISIKLVRKVKKGIKKMEKIRKLISEISTINIEILKED